MIEFNPEYYFLGFWFIGHNADAPVAARYDWLMAVWREQPAGDWTMRYRIRRHHGEDPWDNDDAKTWYGGVGSRELDDEAMLARIETIVSQLSGATGQPCHSVIVQGDGQKAMALMLQQPWCHDASGQPLDVLPPA